MTLRPEAIEPWPRLLYLWLFGPETCRKCGLLRCEAQDVECRCEWAWAKELSAEDPAHG